jgi:hypothetical protein
VEKYNDQSNLISKSREVSDVIIFEVHTESKQPWLAFLVLF